MVRTPSDLDVWVLAGQSNMQGAGWLEGALEPDDRVWSFTSAGEWEIAREPLHRLWESFTPVHQELLRAPMTEAQKLVSNEERIRVDRATRRHGAGLGISFGKAMADALDRPIGLIPAAHGGSSLEQWRPEMKDLGGRSLYGAMLERIRKAGGRLRGVLWYQGESDAADAELGRTYADRLDAWISALRSDTGVHELPVVAVQIGRIVEPPDRWKAWCGVDFVREALGTLPQRVPHTAVTSAIDLAMADPFHLDTPSLIRLGRRLARLALGWVEGRTAPHGPSVVKLEWQPTPTGTLNGIRVSLQGVTGTWRQSHSIRGFDVRIPYPEHHEPLTVVNTWVDGSSGGNGRDLIVLLSRDAEEPALLGYGLGADPVCTLVDSADMPLCAFLPREATSHIGT